MRSSNDMEEHQEATRRTREVRPMVQVARTLRRTLTPAEQRLWELLRNRNCGGYRFGRQVPAAHFVLDFYCPAVRLCIEVDGGIHTTEAVRAYDTDREAILRDEMKITVLRLTNAEVNQTDPETLKARILHAIGEAEKALPPPGERPARFPGIR